MCHPPLAPERVALILSLRQDGLKLSAIAARVGCSTGTAGRYCARYAVPQPLTRPARALILRAGGWRYRDIALALDYPSAKKVGDVVWRARRRARQP